MRPEVRAHYLPDSSDRDLLTAGHGVLEQPERRERLLRALRRIEQVPALLAASPHLLVIGRAA